MRLFLRRYLWKIANSQLSSPLTEELTTAANKAATSISSEGGTFLIELGDQGDDAMERLNRKYECFE